MDGFNPADHNIDEIQAHVKENPLEAKAVLEAEEARGDDARVTLVTYLQELVAGQPDVPVPVEPAAVTVAPVDQSELKTDNVFGKDYTVTPDRGYRRS